MRQVLFLALLFFRIYRAEGGSVLLLDAELECQQFPWRINFTYVFNSSFAWDPFGSYRYTITCYEPSAQYCGMIVQKRGLTVKREDSTYYVHELVDDIHLMERPVPCQDLEEASNNTPYCTIDFFMEWLQYKPVQLRVLCEPAEDPSIQNVTCKCDDHGLSSLEVTLLVSLSAATGLILIVLASALVLIRYNCCKNVSALCKGRNCSFEMDMSDVVIKDADVDG